MNTSGKSVVSIGIVSLITFFTVLLLVTFSVLIIVGARSDAQLSKQAAAAVTNYYIADGKAEQRLEMIHNTYLEEQATGDLTPALKAIGVNVVETTAEGVVVDYTISIDTNRELYCKIFIPADAPENMVRQNWQTTIVQGLVITDEQPLWG